MRSLELFPKVGPSLSSSSLVSSLPSSPTARGGLARATTTGDDGGETAATATAKENGKSEEEETPASLWEILKLFECLTANIKTLNTGGVVEVGVVRFHSCVCARVLTRLYTGGSYYTCWENTWSIPYQRFV